MPECVLLPRLVQKQRHFERVFRSRITVNMKPALIILVIVQLVDEVWTHGRLIDPPGRSTMWRYGFNTPANYDDNALFCGGRQHLWEVMDGKCGLCGDPYDQRPRMHEVGGKYATGTIAGSYVQGDTIYVSVEVTANHGGYFEFSLCPLLWFMGEANERCFERNPLSLTDGTRKYTIYAEELAGIYTVPLKLPGGVICEKCVLQWKWVAANSWGCDKGGDCCIGCGAQERFVNCADITILPARPFGQTPPPPPAKGFKRRRVQKIPGAKETVIYGSDGKRISQQQETDSYQRPKTSKRIRTGSKNAVRQVHNPVLKSDRTYTASQAVASDSQMGRPYNPQSRPITPLKPDIPGAKETVVYGTNGQQVRNARPSQAAHQSRYNSNQEIPWLRRINVNPKPSLIRPVPRSQTPTNPQRRSQIPASQTAPIDFHQGQVYRAGTERPRVSRFRKPAAVRPRQTAVRPAEPREAPSPNGYLDELAAIMKMKSGAPPVCQAKFRDFDVDCNKSCVPRGETCTSRRPSQDVNAACTMLCKVVV